MDAPTVLKGTLRSDRATKAVVILRDQNTPEATVSTEMTKKASCYQISGIRPNTESGTTLFEWHNIVSRGYVHSFLL